ncbi:uncharacterized protein PRCAT00003475001 [Priceomyces carsonii]|uniref:uncharacterized protein n=1 Tax=Priceomyces carsonii TaxID=28549 RepID=UPI002ED9C340|nr:unnamed protein product [Priceomyces carsonii]
MVSKVEYYKLIGISQRRTYMSFLAYTISENWSYRISLRLAFHCIDHTLSMTKFNSLSYDIIRTIYLLIYFIDERPFLLQLYLQLYLLFSLYHHIFHLYHS